MAHFLCHSELCINLLKRLKIKEEKIMNNKIQKITPNLWFDTQAEQAA